MTAGPMRAVMAVWVLGGAAAFAQAPEVKTPGEDVAGVRAAFEAARRQEQGLITELELLRAEYHEPKADKQAVAAKFEAAQKRIPAVREQLETAAFALAIADASHPTARKLCGLAISTRLKLDDPRDALRLAEILDRGGAADGSVDMMAATAAVLLSRLDDAAAWLDKAEANGIQKPKVAELRGALDDERRRIGSELEKRKAEAAADNLPRVVITTSQGDVVAELFEDDAPNTVANFISLVEKGFYDGTPFHRVIGGFMAQGGDPTGTGAGGPGYAIECECGLPTARRHLIGSLSMAHAGKDTGGSQFFLTFRPTEHLDGKHTVFGQVVEGFDVLPRLMRTQDMEGRSIPGLEPDTIVKAKVLRKRDHPYTPKTLPDPRK